MPRTLGTGDWLLLAALIIVAAVIIYYVTPLAVLIAILAVAYIIYRWYTGRRIVSV